MKIKITREHSNKMEELKERNREAGKTHVRIGVFSQAAHASGGKAGHQGRDEHGHFTKKSAPTPAAEGDMTMVELAAIHEFGSPAANIPERSFIRATIHAQGDEIKTFLRKAAKAVVRGDVKVERVLNVLGTKLAADMKKLITTGDGIPPPLKDATVRAKGSSRPLVDTGQLKNSITHVVVTGDEPAEGEGGE